MTEYTHSIVLFSGEDGLPLEFNIQNTVDKSVLKSLIEHGGGLCTLDEGSIQLVSPGTTVVNINPTSKLVSSRYILDCVKQNCLLNMDDYKLEITELETSDISEGDSGNAFNDKLDKIPCQNYEDSIDIVDEPKRSHISFLDITVENNDVFDKQLEKTPHQNSNFVDVIETHKVMEFPISFPDINVEDSGNVLNKQMEKTPHHNFETLEGGVDKPTDQSISLSGPIIHRLSVEHHPDNGDMLYKEKEKVQAENSEDCDVVKQSKDQESSIAAIVVSSSQPDDKGLDGFDNIVLDKLHEKVEDPDSLSQSYTVSSSADAQVSSKSPPHHTSAEIFLETQGDAPDSQSQTVDRQIYIQNLEKEIEQILKKPSPRSIQDKITFVKYICVIKKLPPAIVLQTLQNF